VDLRIHSMVVGLSPVDIGIRLDDPIRKTPEVKLAALLQYHRAECEAAHKKWQESLLTTDLDTWRYEDGVCRGLEIAAAAIGMPVIPRQGRRRV
jgi:hypothetical protein